MSLKELKDCSVLVTPTSFAKYNRDLAADFEKIVGNVQYNNTGKPLKATALDAFMQEPPLPENKLLSLDQVIATPHMGAATDNASDEMTRISIMDCIAVLKGEKPKYPVTGPEDNI